MTDADLHGELIVFDGLNVSNWSRAVFEDMRAGGLTCANCTCSIWEGFQATMGNIAAWKGWFRDHADLMLPVFGTEDIRRAKREGRTGIILGFQNTSAFEDRIGYVQLFKELYGAGPSSRTCAQVGSPVQTVPVRSGRVSRRQWEISRRGRAGFAITPI